LAGLSIFVFVPEQGARASRGVFTLLCIAIMGCSTLLFVAINSNFANGMTLAAATAYVGLGLLRRSLATFVLSLFFIGCLMSGYSELLVFVGAVRFIAVLGEGVFTHKPRWILTESALLLLEVLVASLILPWAAMDTWVVYKTTLALSHAGASDQSGSMFAGLPLALTALVVLWLAWGSLQAQSTGARMKAVFASVLLVFGLAQLLMLVRGYSYGGFKISEYFVTCLTGVMAACCTISWQGSNKLFAAERWRHVNVFALAVIALAMLWHDARMIKRSYEFANDRRITRDLVAMGQWLHIHMPDELIAMGATPTSFYYGHWVPYVTDTHMVYNWSDPGAAGYLSPYLRLSEKKQYADAKFVLSIDDIEHARNQQPSDVAAFGLVHLSRMTSDAP
jgi:hypothetical protein